MAQNCLRPMTDEEIAAAMRRGAKAAMFDRFPDGPLWAELVPYIAKPWSTAAAVHDLFWHNYQGLTEWGVDLPRPKAAELAARWGWTLEAVVVLDWC